MKIRRRKQEQAPHPNPATELKLQHILALIRLRDNCHVQIELYLDELENAQISLGRAIDQRASYAYGITAQQLNDIRTVTAERTARAEEGIREQRAIITALNGQITDTTGELTQFDMAYLTLTRKS